MKQYRISIAPVCHRRSSFVRILQITLLAILFLALSFTGCAPITEKTITAFCGAASKPAIEEAAKFFAGKTGIQVYAIFGGSGTVLSQMKITREGDLYIPGSPDYMVIAEREGIVQKGEASIIAYLVPAILVQPGNPKNIKSLSDLAQPGIKVGIGNPEAVCVGLYAVEILDRSKMLEAVGKNIVTYAESCEKVASLIPFKAVDAIMGWDVFAAWNPNTMDVVYLQPSQIPRLAYIPVAVATSSKDKENASKFRDFLLSSDGQKIFNKWGYIATEKEARKFSPNAQIGGEYKLPANYKPLVK